MLNDVSNISEIVETKYSTRGVGLSADSVAVLASNLAKTEDAYAKMMKSFYNAQPEVQKYKESVYTVSGITAEGFPDVYAGAYVNKDMNLVVALTEDCISTSRNLIAGQTEIYEAYLSVYSQ